MRKNKLWYYRAKIYIFIKHLMGIKELSKIPKWFLPIRSILKPKD